VTYRPGQRVRVSERAHAGHHRTPGYLKGKTGTIERVQGAFRNPEGLAYGGEGLPKRPLYAVSFSQRELWPAYGGPADDRLEADLYEHWLEEPE
jgi:nitrile hydratase